MLGARLKKERERLGLTQPAFADVAGAKKRTLIDWEQDVSSPTAVQLAALAAVGVDALYVLTGSSADIDAFERRLIDSYRRCNSDQKAHLLEQAALLAAGLSAPSSATAKPRGSLVKVSARGGHAAGRDMTVSNNNTTGRKTTDGSAKNRKPTRASGGS